MDPISGGTSALLGTVGNLMVGILDLPVEIVRSIVARSSEGASDLDTSRIPTAGNQTRGEILTPASSRPSSLRESSSVSTSTKGFKTASSVWGHVFLSNHSVLTSLGIQFGILRGNVRWKTAGSIDDRKFKRPFTRWRLLGSFEDFGSLFRRCRRCRQGPQPHCRDVAKNAAGFHFGPGPRLPQRSKNVR